MATSTRTLRLSQRAHRKAQDLAAATKKPMAQLVEELLFAEDERLFWQRYREALGERDSSQIAHERAEIQLWETTLTDRLEPEDWSDHESSVR